MVDQSQFSKLKPTQLAFICETLLAKGFDIDLYDTYEYDKMYEMVENIGKYFNTVVSDEDIQFFAKLIKENEELLKDYFETKQSSLLNDLIIPVAKKYIVEYKIWGSEYYTDEYETTWISYDSDWVSKSMYQARDDGNWDYYDGQRVDRDIRDSETSDFEINDWTEIEDYKNESKIFTKKTSQIIESLDRKSLIELRKIIDGKLNRL